MVRKITAIQDSRTIHLLPAPPAVREPRVIEAEVVGDPDDGEALADFDRENRG